MHLGGVLGKSAFQVAKVHVLYALGKGLEAVVVGTHARPVQHELLLVERQAREVEWVLNHHRLIALVQQLRHSFEREQLRWQDEEDLHYNLLTFFILCRFTDV